MKRVLSLLAIATLATASLSLTACEAPRPRLEKRAVHVKHLHDGRWAYQSDDGSWYIYYTLINGQQTPYIGDSAPSVGSYGGGVMSLVETTPLTETDLSGAIDATAEASFGSEGSPASASEVSADISVESGGESSAGDTGSSDSGSSGGDSGGGGDGGGGDGGGGSD